MSYQDNEEARFIGKFSERLLALWRIEAVRHLRDIRDFKSNIELEFSERHPLLHKRSSQEETTLVDYTFYGIADKLMNLFQPKRQKTL